MQASQQTGSYDHRVAARLAPTILVFLIAVVVTGALGVSVYSRIPAQTTQSGRVGSHGNGGGHQQSLSEKTVEALQKEKLVVETAKIREEISTGGYEWLKQGLTVIGAFTTVGLGIWTLYYNQSSAFKLKVADMVIGSTSPAMARGRLKLMKTMFGDILGPDFQTYVESKDFPATRRSTLRDNLFQIVAGKLDDPNAILELHRMIYPDERAWNESLYIEPARCDFEPPKTSRVAYL